MKEIYISEKNMPKSCDYCDYGKNCIPYKIEKVEEKDKTFSILETYNCPLQSLEQHDKEVRKEFAEKIKDAMCVGSIMFNDAVIRILESILREYGVKE